MKRIIFLKILLLTALISGDFSLKSIYSNKDFKLLLKKDIEAGDNVCDYDDPCVYVNDEYLKIEMTLFNFILKESGYQKPSKKKFLISMNEIFNISPKNKITTLRKEYLYRDKKRPYLDYMHLLDREYYVINSVDLGTDIIILTDERFITFAFRISALVNSLQTDRKESLALKIYKASSAHFFVSINKYLFNNDSSQFKILISKNFITLERFGLLETVVNNATIINKIYFLKYLRSKQNKEEYNYWLNYLNYSITNINNSTHKSLYSFCKATGIKESEIRKLNPWINKDASNISVDAEIVVPNIKKEEK